MNNQKPSAESVFRAMRDTILEASPEELDAVLSQAGVDKQEMARAGREAVGGALNAFRHEDQNENVTMLHKCLGTFLELLRRRDGIDEEELARRAQVDAEEIRRMEYDTQYMPQPRTLFNLEQVFKLPPGALGKLAGAILARDLELQEHATRFAANAKAMGALTSEERKLLNAFVQYLAKEGKE